MGKRPKGPARSPAPGRPVAPFVFAGLGLALLVLLVWKGGGSSPPPPPPPAARPRPSEAPAPPAAPAPAAPAPTAPAPAPTAPVEPPAPPEPLETASVSPDRRPTLPDPDEPEPDEPPPVASATPPSTPPPAARSPSPPSPLKGRHAYAGLPRVKTGTECRLLENIGFAVGYSDERRDPLWVTYHLLEGPPRDGGRRPNRFQADARTQARVKHEDYKQADYSRDPDAFDRGHMAPNYAISTFFGREAQLETFLMSNVCPQRKHLNQQTWEALEKTIASEWVAEFHEVWVTVGPIFGPRPQRLNDVAQIPDAFYALVLQLDPDGAPHLLAVVMGQEVSGPLRLRPHLTTAEQVERSAGIDFFAELPDPEERALEASRADDRWKLDLVREPSRH